MGMSYFLISSVCVRVVRENNSTDLVLRLVFLIVVIQVLITLDVGVNVRC